MRTVQLLSPFNCGSNLVYKILSPITNCINAGSTHLWKHAVYKENIEKNVRRHKNTIFIIMYRPLYSWIKSAQKCSYDLQWDKTLNGPVKIRGRTFKNIIALHEFYYNMYAYLHNKYNNVIFLEYYEICKQDTSYDYLQSKLSKFNVNLTSPEKYASILNVKSKPHGNPVKNSNDALEKYKRLQLEAPNTLNVNHNIVKFFERSTNGLQ